MNGLDAVAAVAAACGVFYFPRACHSLALKSDGTVWAWGDNSSGQLGDGTVERNFRTIPVQVTGLTDVVAIATRGASDFTGEAHSVAVKRDGTVWEWPIWEFDPSPAARALLPVQVAELGGIVAVAGGGGYSLALKSDGTVWAWGRISTASWVRKRW